MEKIFNILFLLLAMNIYAQDMAFIYGGGDLFNNAGTIDVEISLIKSLLEFPNIIEKALDNLEPQTIANYLQGLAGMFHKYYAKEWVVTDDADKTAARLILVRALQIVLSNGLSVLGIHSPKRM